ncbi:MAG: beta-lactamase family protein [Salinivirgaceae bacterium]|nr:beta-lactamase family protein [Salinivirgaceae bacterium]
MQFIKENRILLIWGAIAFVLAFSFAKPSYVSTHIESEENDTLIHFSFTKEQKEELAIFFNNRAKNRHFNGTVLIGQKDSVFYAESFGFANFKNKDTLTLDHSFQLASLSKQFTAVAILQLYEQGLLKLTDSIQRFFPEFPYKGISIHQLLTHRSGLANYHYFFQHIATTCDTLLTNRDVIREMILKKPEVYYSPNKRYHYSNTGYALAAAIVEKVSGLAFEDYVQKNIFSPLHMNHSFTFPDKVNHLNDAATGYLRRSKLAEDNYLDGVLGDKGIYTSTMDLFKWDQGLYNNSIINYDTLLLAFEPMGKPAHYKSNYGYGWRIMHYGNDSIKVLFHGGWWHGFKSLIMRIPKDSTTIIVLRNRSTGGSIPTKSLLKILYPEHKDSLVVNE